MVPKKRARLEPARRVIGLVLGGTAIRWNLVHLGRLVVRIVEVFMPFRPISLSFFVILASSIAAAQIVGNAAGPRVGTVYELRLSPVDAAALRTINRQGYNIGHVTPDYAEIYATPGEYDQLVSDGYNVVIVGQQPNPPQYPTRALRGLGVYHSYAGVTAELQGYAGSYPSITRLRSLGKSVQGRDLWALLITDNPTVDEEEPEFKYVSTMHGDEPVGTEMCLYFIDYLLTNYGSDSRVTNLVNDTAIWIVPVMNPDGLDLGTRANADGYDLNRSFPAFPTDYAQTIFTGGPDYRGLEPEVRHLMYFAYHNSFALSANFHTGAVVASYAYDDDVGVPDMVPAPTPDNPLYVALATTYAMNNPPMYANNAPPFQNGIVNGNDWFKVVGGMQDWMYRFMGMDEITVELSVPKRPSQSLLPQYWNENRESMLSYLEWVHRGVRGLVTDADTGDPLFAYVRVVGNDQPVFTDPDVGDYYRVLPAGTYDLEFTAYTYQPVVVNNVTVTSGAATRVDVQLTRFPNLPGPSVWLRSAITVILALLGAASLSRRIGA